jgi:superfamily I DNA and/or RNA helicase
MFFNRKYAIDSMISKLNGNIITEQEIWEEARTYDEYPNFMNIELSMSMNRLEGVIIKHLKNKLDYSFEYLMEAIEFEKYVNGYASSFNMIVDGSCVDFDIEDGDYLIENINEIIEHFKMLEDEFDELGLG